LFDSSLEGVFKKTSTARNDASRHALLSAAIALPTYLWYAESALTTSALPVGRLVPLVPTYFEYTFLANF